jgi:hypothetical protein
MTQLSTSPQLALLQKSIVKRSTIFVKSTYLLIGFLMMFSSQVWAQCSGTITGAANTQICAGDDASININLNGTPNFTTSFQISVMGSTAPAVIYSQSVTVLGVSAVTIPTAYLVNNTNSNVVYRIRWSSLSDAAACSKTFPDPSLTGSILITVSPLPQITVSASSVANVCPSSNVTYDVSILNSLSAGFNWVATDANNVQLDAASNVSYGTSAINTNLGLSCPNSSIANPIKFTITPIGGSPLFCIGADVIRYVTIQDITAPTWTTVAGNLNRTVSCSDAAALAAAQALVPLGTDNCTSSVAAVKSAGSFVSAGPSCPQGGTYTNTFTLTDACNNTSATYTQVITIVDTAAPTWTSTAGSLNVTYSCSDASGIAAGQAMKPIGTDNCSTGLVAAKTSSVWAAGSTCSQAGTWTNSFNLTDDCGNVSSTFIQIITIIDSTKPSWTTVAGNLNRTVSCSDAAALAAAQALVPTGTDNCTGSVAAVKSAGSFVAGILCPQAGTITNSFTLTDECGNISAPYTQEITIIDNTAPVLTGIAYSQSGYLDSCKPTSTYAATWFSNTNALEGYTDDCSSTLTATLTNTVVTGINCSWDVTYTYTVADECGNTTVGSYMDIGGDYTNPSITGTPYAGEHGINSGMPTAAQADAYFNAALAVQGYTDNCSGISALNNNNATIITGDDCGWTVTYEYEINDDCVNYVISNYTNSGSDQSAPTYIGTGADTTDQSNLNLCAAAHHTGKTEAEIKSLFVDAVNTAGITVVKTAGPLNGDNCGWDITYTYVIKDACGNESANSPITIKYSGSNQNAPTQFGGPVSVSSTVACVAAVITPTLPVVVDGCGNTLTPNAGSPVMSGTYTS